MPSSYSHSIIYRDEFIIEAALPVVAAFICQSARIRDYYPLCFADKTFVVNKSFACFGLIGASLLERSDSHPQTISLKVYSCMPQLPGISADILKQRAFFIMYEDWQLQSLDGATRIIKTWRDLKQPRLQWIPATFIGDVIRKTAVWERQLLISTWNRQAQY